MNTHDIIRAVLVLDFVLYLPGGSDRRLRRLSRVSVIRKNEKNYSGLVSCATVHYSLIQMLDKIFQCDLNNLRKGSTFPLFSSLGIRFQHVFLEKV